MTTEWGFTEEFRHDQPERVRRLERAPPIELIVDAMLKARPLVEVSKLKSHFKIPTRQRVEFCLRVRPNLLDAFFNGPSGYRAQFLQDGLKAEVDVDRWIVRRITDTYREQLSRIPCALRSLSGSQAKVWVRQNQEQDDALLGRTRPVPDISVARWIERMDEAITTPRGPRLLARAGVIASLGRGALDIKGGWIEDGELVVDRYKANNRSNQIRTYGFT